jgi:23S rRNA (uridine2552-2'-O)-methyltransferase
VSPRYEPKDAGYRRAAKAGFRSRAALKLRELDAKFGLFAPQSIVLDLGCWPGGWLQVARLAVGPDGLVVGIDLQPVDELGLANVKTAVADVFAPDAVSVIAALLPSPADIVLSDLSPKLSGVREVDRVRHLALCERVLTYCDQFLAPDGRCLVKLFSDSEVEITEMLRTRFTKVAKHRPDTTRKGSSEIYAFAAGYRAPAPSA